MSQTIKALLESKKSPQDLLYRNDWRNRYYDLLAENGELAPEFVPLVEWLYSLAKWNDEAHFVQAIEQTTMDDSLVEVPTYLKIKTYQVDVILGTQERRKYLINTPYSVRARNHPSGMVDITGIGDYTLQFQQPTLFNLHKIAGYIFEERMLVHMSPDSLITIKYEAY